MCDCKYCSERFNFDTKNGKAYSYYVCLNDDNYLENCFAEDGDKCRFYEPSAQNGICQNITEENPVDDFVCSKCGFHVRDWISVKYEDYYEFKLKYCPNCGAKVENENS